MAKWLMAQHARLRAHDLSLPSLRCNVLAKHSKETIVWRPQDLRDRTYYLSNGVIRVGGRRVATNAAQFTKGDIVGVVLDADQARWGAVAVDAN